MKNKGILFVNNLCLVVEKEQYSKVLNLISFFVFFISYMVFCQFPAKWPRWNTFCHAFVHIFRIFLLLLSLIKNIFVYSIQESWKFFWKSILLRKHFQHFSCFILLCRLFSRGWFPIARKSYNIFKNFASCLERRHFLVFYKWFYNIWGFREIIFYAYLVWNLYSSSFRSVSCLQGHCPDPQRNV